MEGWQRGDAVDSKSGVTFGAGASPRNRCGDELGGGKDAVPIVEDEPVGCLRGDDHARLLDRPLRRGMLGDIPVEDTTRADLEDDEHIGGRGSAR